MSVNVQAAPGKPAEPQKIPERLLLPKEEPDGIADRKELLGELYQRLSKTEDAESASIVATAIEKLWERSGSDTVDLLMNRVAKLMLVKDFDVALQILNSVIDIAPDYSEGWNRRAAVFFVKKEFGKSLENLRHALALDPSHYKAIQGLGLIMQELGDKKAALKAFRHALSVHPHLEDVHQSEKELSREVEGQGI
jgi:tetratricopeptide (TPR) repeat protein